MKCYYAIALGLALLVTSGAAAQDAATLRARIAELQTKIAKLKADGAGSSQIPSKLSSTTISSKAAGDAGLKHEAKPVSPEDLKALNEVLVTANGAKAYALIARHLKGGIEGYRKLFDLLQHVESLGGRGASLIGRYSFNFAHMHHAMLHEKELVQFSHYFLSATRGTNRGKFKDLLYDFLPVFLEFHRGRAPELVRAFHEDINQQFRDPQMNPIRVFSAISRLEVKPPLYRFQSYLEVAKTLQQYQAVFGYLKSLNTREALGVLVRFVDYRARSNKVKFEVEVALNTIVSMDVPEVADAMKHFLSVENAALRGPVLRAYYSKKRDPSEVERVIHYLNQKVDIRQRKRLVLGLNATNPEIMLAIEKRLDEIVEPEGRKLVESQLDRSGTPEK